MTDRDRQIVVVSADVVAEQVADELLLLDFGADRFLSLNPVGARIWQLLVATQRPAAVVDALLAAYDVDEDVLRADVDAFVAQLRALGVVLP